MQMAAKSIYKTLCSSYYCNSDDLSFVLEKNVIKLQMQVEKEFLQFTSY